MGNFQANDLYLWQQLRSGNPQALNAIFDCYAPSLLSYGKLFTSDDGLIEDAIQDIFAILWEKRERLNDVMTIKHYLCSALRRRVLRKLQAQRKLEGPDLQNYSDIAVENSYETWLIRRQHKAEVKEAVHQLLELLTPQQKKVIYLKFFEQLSYDEIAILMKLNKRTVYNTCSAAIQHLKQHIGKSPQLRTTMSSTFTLLLSFIGIVILSIIS